MNPSDLAAQMKRMLQFRSTSLARGIALGISALVLTALAVLAIDVRGLAETVDARASERETSDVRHGLFVLAEATVAEHLVFAGSSEASALVRSGFDNAATRNRFWDNVILDPAEHAYVLDSRDETILSESSAPDLPNSARLTDLRSIAPVIARLRERHRAASAETAGRAIFPGAYVHEVAGVAGKPSLVSAIAIAPSHAAGSEEQPPVLVHVTPLDRRVIGQLANIARLPDLALSETVSPGAATARMALAGSDGRVLAHLTWVTARPGWTVLGALLPIVLLSAMVVGMQGLATARSLSRSAARLAASEAEALRQSRSDASTGLANRVWFEACFAEQTRTLADQNFGLVLIDLDFFKSINDTLGHGAGDAVIGAVAERLKALPLPAPFVAARLGGDEFAVMTSALQDGEDLSSICGAILASIMAPVVFETTTIPVSASIGAALWPVDGRDLSSLMKSADLALYRSKREGRGRFHIHDLAEDCAGSLRLAAAGHLAGGTPPRAARGQARSA